MKRLMILAAMMFAAACGDDSGSNDTTDDDTTPKRDAGRDAGKDAGKDAGRDARSDDDDPTGDDDGSSDDSADASTGPDATTSGGDDCDTLTYATFGKSFMDKYCASCHAASRTGANRSGAPADEVFDTLAQIKAAKSDLVKEVVTEKSMPFVTSKVQPTDDERDQFDAWMKCGPN